jgi:hypothetical protein
MRRFKVTMTIDIEQTELPSDICCNIIQSELIDACNVFHGEKEDEFLFVDETEVDVIESI